VFTIGGKRLLSDSGGVPSCQRNTKVIQITMQIETNLTRKDVIPRLEKDKAGRKNKKALV
jgi:hypothetical protein